MPTLNQLLTTFLACCLVASAQELTLRTTVPLVSTPVTVTDQKGELVEGLTRAHLLLYDNNVAQEIQVEESAVRPSIVIAVQSDWSVAKAVEKIRTIAPLIGPLLAGAQGEAAVVSYHGEVHVERDFTADLDAIDRTLAGIRPAGSGSAMTDAVMASLDLLARQPESRRRIILLMGESRDRSSKTKIEEVVLRAQREKVTVYPVTYSAFLMPFTGKAYAEG